MPANKEYAAGTVPANKKYAAGKVPANKKYAAGTPKKFKFKKKSPTQKIFLTFVFSLYCMARQHPAQKASTQKHGQPAPTDIWEGSGR